MFIIKSDESKLKFPKTCVSYIFIHEQERGTISFLNKCWKIVFLNEDVTGIARMDMQTPRFMHYLFCNLFSWLSVVEEMIYEF